MRERRLSADDDLSYLHEYEHITLARVLLAKHETERAEGGLHDPARLLERLLEAAEAGARTGSVIEILVVKALVHQAARDIPAALVSLERALTLAEPEGYVRLFIDEGPAMVSLLRAGVKQGIVPGYARRLIAAGTKTAVTVPVLPGLIEQLSERELDVLRMLGTDLDGPDIARELSVSLSTVRISHQQNLCQARRARPSSSGSPGQRARPAGAKQRPLTQPRIGRAIAPQAATAAVGPASGAPEPIGRALQCGRSPVALDPCVRVVPGRPDGPTNQHMYGCRLITFRSTFRASKESQQQRTSRQAIPEWSEMSDASTDHDDHAGWYEIRLQGHLAARWSAWFDGLTVTNQPNGTTIISGPVADQAALHGLLQKARDVGVPLLSVTSINPDQPGRIHRRLS